MERCLETLPLGEFFTLMDAEILRCDRAKLEAHATSSTTEKNAMLHDVVVAYHRDREEIPDIQKRALFDWGYELLRKKDFQSLHLSYWDLRDLLVKGDWGGMVCLGYPFLPQDFATILYRRTKPS